MGSPYDKKIVDHWLSRVSKEFAMLIWLAVTSRKGAEAQVVHAGLLHEWQTMSPWEQTNCLYGLKDKINQQMDDLIHISSGIARREDELT